VSERFYPRTDLEKDKRKDIEMLLDFVQFTLKRFSNRLTKFWF